ncbi:hypothetical protein ILUMI_00621 [Ignelater luminosus]|uniref:Ubiquinone biosynthesis O-methyltransferase, mitochondrial n=1 Tax=Ignelater luminosus TaxID=2038154 RepID=A0A8K0DK16_IGNLU|nr:hypothetical protein ILUMI_00621 [Ignelater luminosus]
MSTTPIITPTANSAELAYYEYLSRMWWDNKTSVASLHRMNAIRIPWVVETLIKLGIAKNEFVNTDQPLQDLLILDAGCGGGFVTEALAPYGCTVVGLDICSEILEVAKAHAALDPSLTKNITYVLQCIEEHAEKNPEKYDAVIAFEVLAHLNEPELFLESCVKCLKPDKPIFVATFNRTIASFFLSIVFAEYIWGFIPRGTHNWFRFSYPNEIQEILEKNKCKVQEIRGQLYNFLSKTWHWSGIQALKFSMYAIKKK